MRRERPIRIDHIEDFLSQNINGLPFVFKKYHKASEEQIKQLLQELSQEELQVLQVCTRNFIDRKLHSIKYSTTEQETSPIVYQSIQDKITGDKESDKGTDLYWKDLFTPKALSHREDYSDYVWNIRETWVRELKRVSNAGGCSSCKQNALVRKYSGMLLNHALELKS